MGGTDSTDRVDDVGRGHLRDHGHHVDERDALAPHAGRHNLQYNAVQYSTVQCSTVQYSTVQYSTVQYSTVQYIAIVLQGGADDDRVQCRPSQVSALLKP